MFPSLSQRSLKLSLAGALAGATVLAGLLAGCSPAVPDEGNQAFASVASRNKASFQANGYLVLTAPGRRDYLAIRSDFAGSDDVVMGLDLDDFMQAGFDPARLSPPDFLPGTPVYDLPTSTLLVSFDLGKPAFDFARYKDAKGKALPLPDAGLLIAEIGRCLPTVMIRDNEARYFGLALGTVAALEWAMLPEAGSKAAPAASDLLFAIDPAPLVKAGLDPARLQVWKPARLLQSDGKGALAPADRLVLAYKLP